MNNSLGICPRCHRHNLSLEQGSSMRGSTMTSSAVVLPLIVLADEQVVFDKAESGDRG